MNVKYILIISVLCLIFLSSLNSIEYKQLRHQTGEFVIGEVSITNREDFDYTYRTDNPALLNRIFYDYNRIDSEDTLETFHRTYCYYGNMEDIGNLTRIEYYSDIEGDSLSNSHVIQELDALGRTVFQQKDVWNTLISDYSLSSAIYRHFNASGYADSLYITYSSPPNTDQYRYYVKRYFTGDTLTHCTIFGLIDNQWIPGTRYTYTYVANPTHYPAFIRFDNYIAAVFEPTYLWKEVIYNPAVKTDHISPETWNGTTWIPYTNKTYEASYQGNGIILYESDNDMWGGSYHWTINSEGDIIGKAGAAYNDDNSSNSTYTWDIITATVDHLAPALDTTLKAYPNPFRTDLKFALSSKDLTPADISIYNVKGQLIRQWKGSKATELVWDGKDAAGQAVAQGIYLIKVQAGSHTVTTKALRF